MGAESAYQRPIIRRALEAAARTERSQRDEGRRAAMHRLLYHQDCFV